MRHANVAFFVPHLGCPHDCSFCSQRRITGETAPPTPGEVSRTAQEALLRLGPAAGDAEIAFFGGSFTAVEPALMRSLLAAAAPYTGPGRFRGIRVSTRPDAVDPDILQTLKEFGVTAVELGAQSMDDRVLALNARGHTAQDVREAAGRIREAGFSLTLQMMTGLYGDTPGGARQTARELAELVPDSVRVYPTVVLRGTALEQHFRDGRYAPQSLEEAVALGAELLEFFESRGIPVIRLGLHASEGIERGYVAGPWHPAFRELCEGVLYRRAAEEALHDLAPGPAVLLVAPGCVSKLAGQHRSNLAELGRLTGRRLKIREQQGLAPRGVRAVLADEAGKTPDKDVERCF